MIAIVGPTAVGKTSFALTVAEHVLQSGEYPSVEIVSADSRQVYQGLEIISGVDLPPTFTQRTVTEFEYPVQVSDTGRIRIHGQSIVPPTVEWSVNHFQNLLQQVVAVADQQHSLVMVVGGTGLYQQFAQQSESVNLVPPDPVVRATAEHQSVAELQQWLTELSANTFNGLNDSDRANPRRLVRAIERSLAAKTNTPTLNSGSEQSLIVGLVDELELIETNIRQRVTARLEQGAAHELERLLEHYPHTKLPAYSATGVRPLLALLSGDIDEATCRELWITQERQYAKRQLTWWKKQTGVKWFTISAADWRSQALRSLTTWLNSQ